MSSLPHLYQPSAVEILKVTESAKRRHPALASRIEKAADILRSGALQLDALAWDMRNVVRWKCASQSGKGAYVIVNGGCPCEDSRINGAAYCKHAIAVTLMLKILSGSINADIRARQIDLGILVNGEFHAYADKGRMGYVQLRKVGMGYAFVDAASAVRYSLWLAAQQPVPALWPVASTVAA